MRIPALVVLMASTAVALAACGGEEKKDDAHAEEAPAEAAAETPAAPVTPPGPAPVEGYDWGLSENPEQAGQLSLSYHLPESDDIPLNLLCQAGSGQVTADLDSEITGVGAIILRSGEAQGMYPVTSRTPSELSGGEFLTVDIPLSDPTLQAFKTNGWLNLSVAGTARDLAAHPGTAQAQITSFFERCGAQAAPAGGAASPSSSSAPAAASPG